MNLKNQHKLIRPAFCVCFLLLMTACPQKAPEKIETGVEPNLAAHSAEFKQEVIEVTDGVHVAIGFGLANSILIEGHDGVIIVDTMESAEAAVPVKAAFDRITDKPVKAIIYTHFHPDHTFGAEIMAGDDRPDIYSHADTLQHLDRVVSITTETTFRRGMRQFGSLLPEGGVVNAGIGPKLWYDGSTKPALIRPNKTFSGERLKVEVAGVQLELVHAPGETPDQIFIWMPGKKMLLPADNYYKSFPNLYAIRGTAYRDVNLWVKSLDTMRALRPEYLVPGHTRPIIGAAKIYEVLTDYRDAIQFVHDQTVRWMNRGLTPDEIVERVKLPAHLARKPYLHEYYGTVAWSVRAVFDGYLGWFGGNATDLFPLSQKERAQRFVRLAGGEAALRQETQKAVDAGDHQWALELADQLIRINPEDKVARALKAKALNALAGKQIASTARNYYLTQALEVENKLEIENPKTDYPEIAHSIPLDVIFKSMAVRLDPDKCRDLDMVAGFRFPDTGEAYTVHVRRGIAEVQPRFPENPEIVVTVDSSIWKEIAAGQRNPALALVKDMKKEGGTIKLVKFLGLFK